MRLRRNSRESNRSDELKKPLIIITGPTASGKTSVSIELAKAINGAVISADSMQVYKYMDIGTAKVTKEEQQGVDHYLIDELEPNEPFHVQLFQQKTKDYMDKIISEGKQPIIAGGTGFYIQSIIYDTHFEAVEADESYRDELLKLSNKKGVLVLHNQLKQVDPYSAETIHPNNVKRVIRALEYYRQAGQPISVHNEKERQRETPYHLAYYVLTMNRERLYSRINERVDLMIQKGLVEEVNHLKDMGYTKELIAMKGLGYKEIFGYLDGEYDLDHAINKLKRDTRHYAKRQLTWFKRERQVSWLNVEDYDFNLQKIVDKILKDIELMKII